MKKFIIFTVLAVVVLSSCEKINPWDGGLHSNSKNTTYYGTPVKMGNGYSRSWITISNKGVPKEIGVEMTDEVLYGLPVTNFSLAVPLHLKAKETTDPLK